MEQQDPQTPSQVAQAPDAAAPVEDARAAGRASIDWGFTPTTYFTSPDPTLPAFLEIADPQHRERAKALAFGDDYDGYQAKKGELTPQEVAFLEKYWEVYGEREYGALTSVARVNWGDTDESFSLVVRQVAGKFVYETTTGEGGEAAESFADIHEILTLEEVFAFLEENTAEGDLLSSFQTAWEAAKDSIEYGDADSLEDALSGVRDAYAFTSDFYPQLQDAYEEKYQGWVEGNAAAMDEYRSEEDAEEEDAEEEDAEGEDKEGTAEN